jgi:hypothetical protein
VKKLMIGGIVALMALVPAASASAADDLRLEGPTVSLSRILDGVFTGDPSNSGGGPIEFAGTDLGLQANGSTRYRQRGDEAQLRWTLKDFNVQEGEDVDTLLIDIAPRALQILFLDDSTTAEKDGVAKLDLEGQTTQGAGLSPCGTIEVMIPDNVQDIGIGTLTVDGDPASQLIFGGGPCALAP